MDGQRKLKGAKRAPASAPAGSARRSALYLAAAGIGTLGIVDFDVVDVSNLQRQILHGTPDVGRPKLQSGPRPPRRRSTPRSRSKPTRRALTSANALEHLQGLRHHHRRHRQLPDPLPRQRRLRAARQAERLRQHLPLRGQASVFYPRGGPCYRCLYPEPPPPGLVPSCAEGGVLGILPGSSAPSRRPKRSS